MLGRRLLPLVLALCFASFASADHFKFVVAGDGRSDPGAKPQRPEDVDGVNTLITSEIANAVVQEKARFLMWTGDLVLGDKNDGPNHEKQLRRWVSLMKPVYDHKIKVLACRGNHEATSKETLAAWNKVFSGRYSMPMNGPADAKNLTFYYQTGPVLAIGLDEYATGYESVSQAWLDGVLKMHKKPFVFAMGHEPTFMDGSHKDTMDADPKKRDALWESLMAAGSRVFFAGHDHLYDHMVVTRAGANPGPKMHQIVAGTAGAPFYKQGDYVGNNAGWSLRRVAHFDQTYGYVVVEIDGNKATVTFKGRTAPGIYSAMDSFSYVTK